MALEATKPLCHKCRSAQYRELRNIANSVETSLHCQMQEMAILPQSVGRKGSRGVGVDPAHAQTLRGNRNCETLSATMPMTTLAQMFEANDRQERTQRERLGLPSTPQRHDVQMAQLGSELAFVESGDANMPGLFSNFQRPEQNRPIRFTRARAPAAVEATSERTEREGHPDLAVRQHVVPAAATLSMSPLEYPTAGTEAAQRVVQDERVYEGEGDLKRMLTTRQLTAEDLQGNLNICRADAASQTAARQAPPEEDSKVFMICLGAPRGSCVDARCLGS